MKPTEISGPVTLRPPSSRQLAGTGDLGAGQAAQPLPAAPRHSWLWWACHGLVWIVALALLAAALLRVFNHDGTHLLTWINAFTRYVYLPAYACLAWAWWSRRWMLTLVSLAVVGFHLAWNLPDFIRDKRFDAQTHSIVANEPHSARIFFANVLATNHDLKPLWKEIERADPDIVVLAECSRFTDRSLRQTPAMEKYLHSTTPTRTQIGEVRIYSKLPIKSESQHWVGGRVIQKIDVQLGPQTLRVIGLHAPRPQLPGYDYYGYYQNVVPLLTAEPGPVVIIGDFNATQHSLVYKQLKDGGLRSAHDDRGRGYATTWPNGHWPLPPIRIDQAFLSPDVACMRITEGQGAGSDHKPLVLEVAVGGPQAPALASANELKH